MKNNHKDKNSPFDGIEDPLKPLIGHSWIKSEGGSEGTESESEAMKKYFDFSKMPIHDPDNLWLSPPGSIDNRIGDGGMILSIYIDTLALIAQLKQQKRDKNL